MADIDGFDFTPVTLRNVGVPVRLAVLDRDDKPTYDDAGAPLTETGYLQFDLNVLAEFEAIFGSVQGFAEGIDNSLFNTLRMALAIALGIEPKIAARRVPNDENGVPDTVAAIFVALAICQGVDPTKAAMAYPEIQTRLREAQAGITADIGRMLDLIVTPSTPPSDESTSETNSEPTSEPETSNSDESFPSAVV